MKNKKTTFLMTTLAISFLSIAVTASICLNNNKQIESLRANGDVYTLNIKSLSKTNNAVVSRDGNDISFDVNGFASGIFANNGYIKNTTAISGLQSITVSFETLDNDLLVSYGWDYDDYVVADEVINSDIVTYNFSGESPSFFLIENKTGSLLRTTNIELTYSCSESAMPTKYDKIEYTLSSDNQSYYVSGYKTGIKNAVIQSEYNGLPVTSIGYRAFQNCSSLVSVTVPNSITKIGFDAFRQCTSLASINIPNTVVSIEQAAFYFCSSLTSISIPNGITSIGVQTFWECESLSTVVLGDGISSIGGNAFSGCKSLVSIVVPSSLSSISDYSFNSCESLTSVFYKGLETDWNTISFGTGNDCLTNASTIEFESTVNTFSFIKTNEYSYLVTNTNKVVDFKMIDKSISSFDFGSELPELEILSIGKCAFSECFSLTSITIPNSVTSIGERAFEFCSSLSTVSMPNTISSIGISAFMNCTSLTSITIPECVKEIKLYTFQACFSLKSITIPNSVIEIGESAFAICESLTSAIIGNSVISIGPSAFDGCSKLTSITIPNSVNSIGNYAFCDCESLTSVFYKGLEIEWDTISIGTGNECLLNATIEFESGVNSFTYVTTSKCSYYKTNDNRVFDLKIIDKTITSFDFDTELPGMSVLSFGVRAFEGCSSLSSIVIPDTVISIGGYAFFSCHSLVIVYIPQSVSTINEYAFYDATSATIYCQASSQPIGWSSTWNCSNCPVIWGYNA